MKRNILLHIGLPKTASTALQKWCYEHTKNLYDEGIYYANSVDSEDVPSHNFLVHELKSGNFFELNKVIEESKVETIFLSSEALSNQFQDFSDDQFKLFRKATAGHGLIVFVVARNWDDWVRSYYSQCLINPAHDGYPYATPLVLESFSKIERVRYLWNLPNHTNELKKAFGATKIIVANFEGDWLGVWSRAIGLSKLSVMLSRANSSLDQNVLNFVLKLNQSDVSVSTRSYILSALQRSIGAKNPVLKMYGNYHVTHSDKEAAIELISSLAKQDDETNKIVVEITRMLCRYGSQ